MLRGRRIDREPFGRSPRPAAATNPHARRSDCRRVEELNALLNRIHQVERDVSREMQGRLGADIDRLKKQISSLEGDEFERAFRELETAMRQRRELAGQIREETFRRIDADSNFEPRRYLRLIARDRAT